MAYDPAYAYELAVIIQDGIRRMYEEQEDVFYYLTVMNENYAQPADAGGRARRASCGAVPAPPRAGGAPDKAPRAQLLGSGAILNEVVRAQALLAEKYGVAADVWSVTSYKELYHDAADTERWNRLHPGEKPRAPVRGRMPRRTRRAPSSPPPTT